MFRRPQYVAFSVILFLGLILISLPTRTTTRLKVALGSLFLPLFGVAGSAQQLSDQAGASMRSKRALLAELEQLRRENERLRLDAAQRAQIWEENEKLRQALVWQRQAPWKLKLGRVILRDPANWWRTMHIDLGQRDGVVMNLPVLTAEGLVGRVNQVGLSTAQVVLIGDPNCRVSALVEEVTDRSGAARKTPASIGHGVIASGSSSILDPSIVDLTYVDRQSPVKPGQRVITSGAGGIFPRGIPIGHVADVSVVDYGLYFEARVKLAANIGNLEHVWVMIP